MNNININSFIKEFNRIFHITRSLMPWEITIRLPEIINGMITSLGPDFNIRDGIAIHKTATVEDRAILKAPVIIERNCFIGANAYLRGGVFLGENSSVGPSCEIKTSIIFHHTEIAHLNFIGDSIIGSNCNLEAGSITANYFNERPDKTIFVIHNSEKIKTSVQKFGSLIGDNCKIGANAVLSPGSILMPGSIVKRLELVEQDNKS